VNWVYPLFLGNAKEFEVSFTRPITAGENSDATKEQRNRMKRRTYVLNRKLKAILHRVEWSGTDQHDFGNKREFVVTLRMTDYQKKMMKIFINRILESGRAHLLFTAYQTLVSLLHAEHPKVSPVLSLLIIANLARMF
jgi:SNF2 family DNA or RNA helicase